MSNTYTFSEYESSARETACYPKGKGMEYALLGGCGEMGELANKYKKVIRGDKVFDAEFKKNMADELGDVMWYMASIAYELDVSLEDVAKNNIKKLHSRKERGVIKGDGDNR